MPAVPASPSDAEIVIDNHLQEIAKEKIVFLQDNANNLKPIHSGFDVIIANNVLEELNNPIQFLQTIHQRLHKQGILIVASSYNWKKNNIPAENWLGGYKKDGEPVTGLDAIKENLQNTFVLLDKPFDLQKIAYISTRESSVQRCEVSIWQKKS